MVLLLILPGGHIKRFCNGKHPFRGMLPRKRSTGRWTGKVVFRDQEPYCGLMKWQRVQNSSGVETHPSQCSQEHKRSSCKNLNSMYHTQKFISRPVNLSIWLISSLICLLGQPRSLPYQQCLPLLLRLQLWPTEINEKEKERSFSVSIPSGNWKFTTDLVVPFIWGSSKHVHSIIHSFLSLFSKAVLFCFPRWSNPRLRDDERLAQAEVFNAKNPTWSSQA